MADVKEFESIDEILKKLSPEDYEKVRFINYGKGVRELPLDEDVKQLSSLYDIEVQSYAFDAKKEELRAPRITKVGLFQHKHPVKPATSIRETREALYKLAAEALEIAHKGGVNIFCFQELWNMPFVFCTREKHPWTEYAESAQHGPTIKFLSELAKQYNMVIISPILERDQEHGDIIWNAAVFIDNYGDYLGKHRKNHIPRVGSFSESGYYMEGNSGHPVFETEFGKIATNICYGRHHPLNWLGFGLNGAEIVFNPSATIGDLGEPIWGVESRNAAVANAYFTCAINRVGTEVFEREFTTGDGEPARKEHGHFYGSSFVAAPNGSRSPGLSRTRNGLLISELDLNLCRQIKDYWTFQMTQRLELYADLLTQASKPDFKPQLIRKN